MFKATITSSLKELTAREKVKFSDFSNSESIDTLSQQSTVQFIVDNVITLKVENDKSENGEYDVYLFVTPSGSVLHTSSRNFYDSVMSIIETLHQNNDNEPIEIEVVRKDSKNFKGKQFITAVLV